MWSLQVSKRVPSDRRPAHSLRHACIIKFGAFQTSKCGVEMSGPSSEERGEMAVFTG